MVTELAKLENSYQVAFRSMRETKPAVPWVELVRGSAMDRFELLGFPSIKGEEWKYTNLAPLARDSFEPATIKDANIAPAVMARHAYPETSKSHVVLVNGFLRADLSDTSAVEGLVILDLFDAIADARYNKLVREYLARNAHYHDNGLTALNTAFIQSGLFVYVPRNLKLSAPLLITILSHSPDRQTASFPRVLVVADENSSATIIENHAGAEAESYFSNTVVEIVLKAGARLEHYRLQRESRRAFHVGNTSAELGRGSSYNTTSITLGAQLSRHDISVVMDNDGAECWVDGLYVVGQDQHADTHSVIDHQGPYCNSRQLYKGILDGNARAVFNGKIFVRHGAQKTDAIQTNKNLLLSDKARVDTKPQLEIFADDVKCAHGAAIGQIDQDELFYLQTRGINPELGRKVLTYGFAEEVIGKIKVDALRADIDAAVLSQLNTILDE